MLNRSGNIVITRGNIGQFGSFLTGLGFLVGILGLLWQASLTLYIVLAFAVGILGAILWAYMTPDDFKNFVSGRQARRGTIAFFSTLLLVGIVALLYILAQRAVFTVDMTQGERFTLSNETLDVIDAVGRSVEPGIRITGFYTPQELIDRELDDQYWILYDNASPKISRDYIDPLAEPGKAAPYNNYLRNGVNVFIAFEDENGEVIFPSTIPVLVSGAQERDMTEALTRLLLRGRFKVYFESSLGTMSGQDDSQQGLSTVNDLLRTNGIETDGLSLQDLVDKGETIPTDASALIIAGPTIPPTQAQIDVIDDYVQRGGSLFILADVSFSSERFLSKDSLFNNYLWNTFGLRGIDAVVIDGASSSQSETDVISFGVFPGNPIGQNLNNPDNLDSNTLFRMARPIEVNENPPVNNGRVILTSPFSWGETNYDSLLRDNQYEFDEKDDIQGPLTTVAWANDQATGAKMVIVGDSDFVTNGQILSPTGNSILFFDSIGWMTGFTEQVTFEPQILTTGLPIIFIDIQTVDLIAFITIILMPGTMLMLAIAIWGRRLR